MSPIRRIWNAIRRRRLDDELRQEVDTHLALIEEEERANGLSAEQARRRALARFGSPMASRERSLEAIAATWLENLGKDFVFAARRLMRSPTFTVAAVLTLALAIAANAAIFAVVYRVILNPLPFADSARVISLEDGMPSRNVPFGFNSLTTQLYYAYLERAHALESLALYRIEDRALTGQGDPERVLTTRATPSLASVLRIAPVMGRWFTEVEGVPGGPPVAVLSYSLWTRRYGADPNILGRTIALDGVSTAVVGVMPAWFTFPNTTVDAWTPLPLTRASATDNYSFTGIARLRQGATLVESRAELNRLHLDLERDYPGNGYSQLVSAPATLIQATTGRVAEALWIVLASVGLVLLVACANVANLFLVRSEVRQREVMLRAALGADRGAIARYYLCESVLLSMVGGILGFGIAWGSIQLLVAFGPANLPRLNEVQLDAVALLFTLGLVMLTAVAFGGLPLLRSTPLAVAVRDGGRGHTQGHSRHRIRQLLMGGQVALALVLLVASGLMLRSFQELRAVNPNFDPASALTFRVGLPPADYPDRGRMAAAHISIIDELSRLPGVARVSAATCLPLLEGCNQGGALFVDGLPMQPGQQPPIVLRRAVAGGFFETMGMRIVRGRSIAGDDVERNEPIAVITESLVKVAFAGTDPIGRRVRFGNRPLPSGDGGWLTIAGVVADTPVLAVGEARALPQLYMPVFASRQVPLPPRTDAMTFVVKTVVPPAGLTAAARAAVARVDPKLALAQIRTLQEILDRSSSQMAFTMVLLAIAAAVALTLGLIGVYGVMSYIVSQRRTEIGVRLALGAAPGSVAGMIVRQGGLVALAGVAIGIVAALAASRLIESVLYGVSSRDPIVFASTALLLVVVAIGACWIPARRAARLSPLEALRTE
jgi:putative ABC transport system permease protein